MFKANKIFVQFFRNKVRAVYLNTGQEVTLQALTPFSSQLQVVSSFSAAE